MSPEDNSGVEVTGGYLVEVDAYADRENSWFRSNSRNPVTIKSPSEDSITTDQRNYIRAHFNRMENDLDRYVDKNTFLRLFLVGELSGNTDTYWSLFMYKERDDDTMYTGPVWDYDLAFDNDERTYPVNNKRDYVYRSGGSYAGTMKQMVDNMLQNTKSQVMLFNIWDEARRTTLTEESLVAYIDQMEEELEASQKLNFMRWAIMNTKVHMNPKTWGSYQAEVENVRRFMKERLTWMDKKLGYTYDPSGILEMEVDYDQPYEVYSVSGQPMGQSLEGLKAGIYIVKQGDNTKKVVKK
jgi:hypothetical protein